MPLGGIGDNGTNNRQTEPSLLDPNVRPRTETEQGQVTVIAVTRLTADTASAIPNTRSNFFAVDTVTPPERVAD